jgi:hypothetical protein
VTYQGRDGYHGSVREAQSSGERERLGGAEGNERLTALIAGLVIALLTVRLAGALESPDRLFFHR